MLEATLGAGKQVRILGLDRAGLADYSEYILQFTTFTAIRADHLLVSLLEGLGIVEDFL